MKCVVVGGGGFIGSHLSEALLKLQYGVTVFDRPGAKYLDLLAQKGGKIVMGDFLQPADLDKALPGTDIVFHLASTTVPKSSTDDPIMDVQSNLVGTINLLNAAKSLEVKKIVFISSGGTVYGIPREIPITETHPTDPISSYGIIKLAIEKYLSLYRTLYGLDYCILRVSNAYGERQPANAVQGVIPTMINRALHHEELRVWGDGTIIRDYIHVSDIVSALLAASTFTGGQKLFNISSGVGHSVNDIVKTLEGIIGESLHPLYEPGRAFDVPINILDNTLARQVLHWEPRVALRDGILQTLEFMQDHQ